MPTDNGGTFTIGLIDVYNEMVTIKNEITAGFTELRTSHLKLDSRVALVERELQEIQRDKEALEDSKAEFSKQVKLAVLSSLVLPVLVALAMLYFGGK